MLNSYVRSIITVAIAAVTLASSGCLVGHSRPPDERRWLRTIIFDSATDLEIVPSLYGDAPEPRHLLGVTELGGWIRDVTGDTLVVAPVYAIENDPDNPGHSRYLTRSRTNGLPDRVLVILQPGTTIRDFRARRSVVTPQLVAALLVAPFYYLLIRAMCPCLHH